MGSAKVIIKEQDRSVIVPSLPGVYGGIVLNADKGPVNKPFLITSENELIDVFGEPNLTKGVAHFSAMAYLAQSNKLWVVRTAHEDIKYAGALVRSKVNSIPLGYPDANFVADPIVKPIGGLTQEEADAYSFPTYLTNRLFALAPNTIKNDSIDSYKVQVNLLDGIEVGDRYVFSNETLARLNDSTNFGDELSYYQVTSTVTEELVYDKIRLETAIDATIGMEVTKADGSAYPNNPTVVRNATASKEILISNADYLTPDEEILIGGTTAVFKKKNVYKEKAYFMVLDNKVTVSKDTPIYKIVQSKFEDRDSFLVLANSQGLWGRDISIGITPSLDYDDAFNIIVYYKGVQVETHHCTNFSVIRNQKQMFLEDVINGKSAYIQVIANPNDVDNDGNPQMPLFTDYSLWRQDPEDIFVPTSAKLTENLLKGHIEVKVDSVADLSMGDRIKYVIGDNGKLSAEYKIVSINSGNNTYILDRPIIEEEISKQWVDGTGTLVDTVVYRFNALNNDAEKGIVNGVQYHKISKIDKVFYNYRIGKVFTISGKSGVLLDAGVNMLDGGDDGSNVTIADYVTSIKKLSNKEETPVTLLMDGGVAVPAYAQALVEVANRQNLTHCYISCDPSAEDSFDYKTAIVDYKAKTMLNTEKASMFTGWVKILDEYSQKEVWVAPDGFAAASQAFTTRNYQIFYPAAGWKRGKLMALDVKVKYSEGDRDWFVLNRINPIRYKKGSGLVIWGNETTLVKPSPMQLRSVSMLLIAIKYGLETALEYVPFELGTERTYSLVEGALDGFMRDDIKAKGGVYDYQLSISGVITDSDQDNRRMPVFLGIQPTMDIKEIPVTLAIFNKSVDIQVAL